MIIKVPEEFDSKFRLIMVAAARAKQIQNGAPPKIDVKGGKPSYVAIKEIEEGLVTFEILEEEEEEE